MQFTFTITAEDDIFPYSDEQLADLERRVGCAVISTMRAYGSEMATEWPPLTYPRTAKIDIIVREYQDTPIALEYSGDDQEQQPLPPYLVFSEAPPWSGEGSACPIVHTAQGDYIVYL